MTTQTPTVENTKKYLRGVVDVSLRGFNKVAGLDGNPSKESRVMSFVNFMSTPENSRQIKLGGEAVRIMLGSSGSAMGAGVNSLIEGVQKFDYSGIQQNGKLTRENAGEIAQLFASAAGKQGVLAALKKITGNNQAAGVLAELISGTIHNYSRHVVEFIGFETPEKNQETGKTSQQIALEKAQAEAAELKKELEALKGGESPEAVTEQVETKEEVTAEQGDEITKAEEITMQDALDEMADAQAADAAEEEEITVALKEGLDEINAELPSSEEITTVVSEKELEKKKQENIKHGDIIEAANEVNERREEKAEKKESEFAKLCNPIAFKGICPERGESVVKVTPIGEVSSFVDIIKSEKEPGPANHEAGEGDFTNRVTFKDSKVTASLDGFSLS